MMPTPADVALAVSQSPALSILAKATGLAALGLIAARLAARGRASIRHVWLAATFGSLLALPLVIVATPGITVDVAVAQAGLPKAAPSDEPAAFAQGASADKLGLPEAHPGASPRRSGLPWATIARAAWLAGTIVFAVPLVIVLARLRRIRRTGLPCTELRMVVQAIASDSGLRRRVDVLRHEAVAAPITFGMRHPVIVMPADAVEWNDADVRRAVVHELEHVRRGDWLVHVMARAVCAVYWFHPLVWAAWRRLGLEAERSCDDAVLQRSESTDYAEQLVSLAHRLSSLEAHPMLGMANRSDLSTRISALLDNTQQRGSAGAATIAAIVCAALLIAVAVAPLRAVAVTADSGARQGAAINTASGSGAGTGIGVGVGIGSGSGNEGKQARSPRRSRALDRALFEAAQDGDLEAVNALIDDGANVNASIEGDGSPLIGAAQSGSLALTRRLLDAGADPNLAVEGDGCPLIQAAARGDVEIVALLLDRGADVNQIVRGDENALMNAAEQGSLPVVQLLVKRGADVNARIWTEWSGSDRRGEWRTAVSQARKNGHTAVVAFLFSVGARE